MCYSIGLFILKHRHLHVKDFSFVFSRFQLLFIILYYSLSHVSCLKKPVLYFIVVITKMYRGEL